MGASPPQPTFRGLAPGEKNKGTKRSGEKHNRVFDAPRNQVLNASSAERAFISAQGGPSQGLWRAVSATLGTDLGEPRNFPLRECKITSLRGCFAAVSRCSFPVKGPWVVVAPQGGDGAGSVFPLCLALALWCCLTAPSTSPCTGKLKVKGRSELRLPSRVPARGSTGLHGADLTHRG